jgi:hypothetical protein
LIFRADPGLCALKSEFFADIRDLMHVACTDAALLS